MVAVQKHVQYLILLSSIASSRNGTSEICASHQAGKTGGLTSLETSKNVSEVPGIINYRA